MENQQQSEIYSLFVKSLKGKKSDERYATDLLAWSKKLMAAGVLEKSAFDCFSVSEFDDFIERFKNSEQYINHRKERKSINPNIWSYKRSIKFARYRENTDYQYPG